MKFRPIICGVLSVALLLPAAAQVFPVETTQPSVDETSTEKSVQLSYVQYLSGFSDKELVRKTLRVSPESVEAAGQFVREDKEGKASVCLQKDAEITYRFTIPESGLYPISLEYFTLPGSGLDIELQMEIDGVSPFEDARRLSLNRVWRDTSAALLQNGRFQTDNRGNEIVPRQEELFCWQTVGLKNKNNYFDESFRLFFVAGEHTVTFTVLRESLACGALFLGVEAELPSYEEQLSAWKSEGAANVDKTITVEAETAKRRSDSVILPVSDRSTPSTSPNSPSHVMLNALGGINWKFPGQWVEWEMNVPESGLYTLHIKYRQDILWGLPSHRRLFVDGTVPYKELDCVEFPYGQGWQVLEVKTYLREGIRTLRLEAVLGDIAQTLQTVEKAVSGLNELYRRIVMITGTAPDIYRDYYLETEIPELLPTFQDTADLLQVQARGLEEKTGSKGNQAALFYEVIRQLEGFVREPYTIPRRLDRFKSNIGALAELLLQLYEQPLQLDKISAAPVGRKITSDNAGTFSILAFRARVFFASFFEDYSYVGNQYDDSRKPLEIWLNASDFVASAAGMAMGSSSGRDQAQVLKRLIDDEFLPTTGVQANLSLVSSAETLTMAILGGRGPDAALYVPKGTPVNLGMRDALVDVSQMPNFAEIEGRFSSSAWIGYRYNGGVYALPETQTFNMLFVRTDIFEELKLEIPQTWDKFYEVVAKLQKRNLLTGIPENQQVFEALLLQNGGSIYTEDLSRTALDTVASIDAFRSWTNLYLQYGLPLAFDFFNRFRTGEMAMGIVPYTMYNQLSVAAPEIRGSWIMVPIPGTLRDGKIVRTESCVGTGCVLIKGTDNLQNAFRFADWWTSDAVQSRFGNELEMIIGASSRYNTANTQAFSRLAWSAQELEALQIQREQVWDIHQTPASYYISRNLTNAFRRAVYYHENPREVIEKYGAEMNKELTRKRQELGLEEAP